MKDGSSLLAEFQQTHNEMDEIYHNCARACGLSDSSFWLLYSIAEHGEGCTQSELCSAWSISPQTLNSTLKSMERDGSLELRQADGDRKKKRIFFTPSGRALYRRCIVPVREAESAAFAAFSPREAQQLMRLTQKQIALLRGAVSRIEFVSSEDGTPA